MPKHWAVRARYLVSSTVNSCVLWCAGWAGGEGMLRFGSFPRRQLALTAIFRLWHDS
jgi:hypothetical protein